jgi:hypothetical protein
MRDRNILITAKVILIIAAIAYYTGGNITGLAVVSDSTVNVYPSEAEIGSTITISINPDGNGINRYATFLKGVSLRGSIQLCQTNRCIEPAEVVYEIPNNWGEGSHNLEYYDYSAGDYREVHFNVRRS